jgi:hypothetical protein
MHRVVGNHAMKYLLYKGIISTAAGEFKVCAVTNEGDQIAHKGSFTKVGI